MPAFRLGLLWMTWWQKKTFPGFPSDLLSTRVSHTGVNCVERSAQKFIPVSPQSWYGKMRCQMFRAVGLWPLLAAHIQQKNVNLNVEIMSSCVRTLQVTQDSPCNMLPIVWYRQSLVKFPQNCERLTLTLPSIFSSFGSWISVNILSVLSQALYMLYQHILHKF